MKTQPIAGASLSPLHSRVIPVTGSWQKWLEQWQRPEASSAELKGLLDEGFDMALRLQHPFSGSVDGPREEDRIIFYLKVADGWKYDFQFLKNPSDPNEDEVVGVDSMGNLNKACQYKIRGEIAQKAYEVLCVKYFNPELHPGFRRTRTRDYINDWTTFVNGPLFTKIQHFFRLVQWDDRLVFPNLSHGDQLAAEDKFAHGFLVELAQFMWFWKGDKSEYVFDSNECRSRAAKIRQTINTAMPWMLEILVALKRLHILEKHALELNSHCVQKLKQIALRKTFRDPADMVGEDRCARNLDEAVYAGSSAANFLLLRDAKLRVKTKLDADSRDKKVLERAKERIRNRK